MLRYGVRELMNIADNYQDYQVELNPYNRLWASNHWPQFLDRKADFDIAFKHLDWFDKRAVLSPDITDSRARLAAFLHMQTYLNK